MSGGTECFWHRHRVYKLSQFETINVTNYLPISQTRLLQIQRETEKDESLQSLKAVIQQGWPDDKNALPPGCLNRVRECLYWPGMTGDIWNHVSTCEACREYERRQTKETLKSHQTPSRPWQYVAADLFELNLTTSEAQHRCL